MKNKKSIKALVKQMRKDVDVGQPVRKNIPLSKKQVAIRGLI